MKTKIIKLSCILIMLILITPTICQVVTKEEAITIAQNWITIVIDSYGTWGNAENASILSVKTLEKDGRNLGYFCHVLPKGFILVSIRKELAPVKLYSETGNYYNDTDDCLPDLFYDVPLKIINAIETELGPIESVSSVELKEILEIDYSEAWDQVYSYIPGTYTKKTKGSSGKDGYQEGDWLLTSSWRQGPPYNEMCPDSNCTNTNGNAIVGCVATAGAQIMNYWSWPPYGEEPYDDPYDWPNMIDSLDFDDPPPTQAQIDAVAELCAEVGEAIEMNYGCTSSYAWIFCDWWNGNCGETSDLESQLVSTFRFDPSVEMLERGDFDTSFWFNEIKAQINASRPIAYGINLESYPGGHAVVVDGWQELGPPLIRQYHINFGWGGGNMSSTNYPCWTQVEYSNMWYTLDELPCFYDDLMLVNIVPVTALGGSLITGTYSMQPFPYRYFDMDASGLNAIFSVGQNLQFLPGVTVTGTGSSSHPIQFFGLNGLNLRLFTRGDPSNGIRLRDGGIELTSFGSIKLH
ncbi:MAG: C10 family peptidase [Bacteroidales bacterium]|nr:C10 family peptidase [Bacteroidales bacterium]